jgi:hypothetical protein
MELFSRGPEPIMFDDRKQIFEVTKFSPIIPTENLLIGDMSVSIAK